MDEFDGILFGFVIAFGILVVPMGIIYGDNVDIDDSLAPYLCEQHDMKLKYVDYELDKGRSLDSLKIVCEPILKSNITAIEDDYLFLET